MNCKNPPGQKHPEKSSPFGWTNQKKALPQTDRRRWDHQYWHVSSAGDSLPRGTQQPWEDTPDLCSGSSSDRTVLFWANQPLWALVPSSIKWISSPILLICENDKLITVNSHILSALLNSYWNPQHGARQLQDRVTVLGPPNLPVQNTNEKCPV